MFIYLPPVSNRFITSNTAAVITAVDTPNIRIPFAASTPLSNPPLLGQNDVTITQRGERHTGEVQRLLELVELADDDEQHRPDRHLDDVADQHHQHHARQHRYVAKESPKHAIPETHVLSAR
jgi:hypothetical protein